MFESKSSRVMTSGMMSSLSDEWETPQQLFDILNAEFGFQTDVCATAENAKCAHFYTKDQNGLDQQWSGVCWMNPPYGREIIQWVKKAFETTQQGGGNCIIVCLLPARTDTKWWQNYIMQASEIRFISGRVRFGDAPSSAPFPSAIAVFGTPRVPTISRMVLSDGL